MAKERIFMEKILAFHLSDTELRELKRCTGALNMRVEVIAPEDYLQTLGSLAKNRKNALTAAYTGELPQESLLVFCDFTEKRMDKLLLSLRKNRLLIDYKAVLTPTNSQWNVLRLLLELRAERLSFEKQ